MEFSRPEYWSGYHFPSPGDLHNLGIKPSLPHGRLILYQLSHKGSPRIQERVAYPFSCGSSQPRNQTGVSCMAGGFFINWAMTEALSLQGNLLRPTCPILCHHHGPLTEPLDQAPHLFFFFSLSHHSLCCPGGSGGRRTLRHMHFWYNQVCFLVKTTKHSDLSSTLWEIPTDLLREGMGRQRFSKIRIWSISQSWSKCLRILNVESKPNYYLEKQTVKLIVCAHLFLILCHPMDCSLPSSSVHGISQARILE